MKDEKKIITCSGYCITEEELKEMLEEEKVDEDASSYVGKSTGL